MTPNCDRVTRVTPSFVKPSALSQTPLPAPAPLSQDDPANSYPRNELSCAGRPAQDRLSPPPSDTPEPASLRYSQSPVWDLVEDPSYLRGYIYRSSHQCALATEKKDQLRTIPHPALQAAQFDDQGSPMCSEVPGCIRMVPGVPFALDLNGVREQKVGCRLVRV